MPVTSILSFSFNLFYFFQKEYQVFSHIYFVVCKCFNPLPNDKVLNETKFKAFADNKLNYKKIIFLSLIEQKTGKRRKCWLPAFSPFHALFSKAMFPRVAKRCDCVGMGLIWVYMYLKIQYVVWCRDEGHFKTLSILIPSLCQLHDFLFNCYLLVAVIFFLNPCPNDKF